MSRSFPRFHGRNVMSPVETLANLNMLDMPDPCSVAVKLAVRVGRQVILVAEDGTIYWPNLSMHKATHGTAYSPGVWPWTTDLIDALCRAGVVTEAQRNQHLEAVQKIDAEKDRAFNLKRLEEAAEALGAKYVLPEATP